MEIEISFRANIDPSAYEDLKKVVQHHLDYLLDLDEFPEINYIFDAKINEIK